MSMPCMAVTAMAAHVAVTAMTMTAAAATTVTMTTAVTAAMFGEGFRRQHQGGNNS
jgi:hypothetical protein